MTIADRNAIARMDTPALDAAERRINAAHGMAPHARAAYLAAIDGRRVAILREWRIAHARPYGTALVGFGCWQDR